MSIFKSYRSKLTGREIKATKFIDDINWFDNTINYLKNQDGIKGVTFIATYEECIPYVYLPPVLEIRYDNEKYYPDHPHRILLDMGDWIIFYNKEIFVDKSQKFGDMYVEIKD